MSYSSKKIASDISVTVRAIGLAVGGSTVAESLAPDSYKGKKGFIPYIIPGEVAEVKPHTEKKSFFEGSLVSIQTPSKHRVTPPCPHFSLCGGCDLQHIELNHQRDLKRQMIEDALKHQGGLRAREGVTLISAENLPSLRYRRRMSFHLNRDGNFGLYRKSERRIVELTECIISTDVINNFLADYLPLIRECAPEIETVTIEDHGGEPFVVLDMHPRSIDPLETLKAKAGFQKLLAEVPTTKVRYRHRVVYPVHAVIAGDDEIPVGHFSQNNDVANQVLVDRVVGLVTEPRATDLYAGAGNLSIPLALSGKTVTAVELNPALVRFGRSKAQALGVADRLEFVQASCEAWAVNGVPEASCVLDPPRSGARGVAEKLSPDVSKQLVYVSCFPPTFIRDAQILVERGFKLEHVEVLDMFPQTSHVELIALFA